ncbi:MAG: GNAT family N-acetyltransferase [Candidatus Uhrbacteria bacterium]
MAINIRPAMQQDMTALQGMLDLLNRERRQLWSQKNKVFHNRLKPLSKLRKSDLNKNIFIVAEVGGEIAGFILGFVTSRKGYKLSNLGYLDALYVKPAFRSKGVAKKLTDAVVKSFKSKGCDHMTTHTDAENKVAQKWYEGAGMSQATVEYWKKL